MGLIFGWASDLLSVLRIQAVLQIQPANSQRHSLYHKGMKGPGAHCWEKELKVIHSLVAGQYYHLGL